MWDGSRDDPEPVGPRVRAKAERVHLGSGAFAVRPRGARAPPAGRSRPRARLRRRTRQRVLRELRLRCDGRGRLGGRAPQGGAPRARPRRQGPLAARRRRPRRPRLPVRPRLLVRRDPLHPSAPACPPLPPTEGAHAPWWVARPCRLHRPRRLCGQGRADRLLYRGRADPRLRPRAPPPVRADAARLCPGRHPASSQRGAVHRQGGRLVPALIPSGCLAGPRGRAVWHNDLVRVNGITAHDIRTSRDPALEPHPGGAQAGVAQGPRPRRPQLHAPQEPAARVEPPLGLRGGALSQHRRMLGGRDRDVHDPGRHLHAKLRLLRDRARHARLGGPRGARADRPGGGRARARDPDQVGHHPRPRRGAGGADRGDARPARGRRVDPDARPVPAAVTAAPARRALLSSRRVRGARGGRPGARVRARRGGAARPQLVPRQAPGGSCLAHPVTMTYAPMLMTFAFAALVAGALLGIPKLIAPRRLTPVKAEPFECGKDPIAVSEGHFAIKFSTIAIFFILIDIELMFVWPWAVVYRRLGWFGFVEMMVFLGILMLG